MDKNQESYNKISKQWDAYRKKTPVNPCIEKFVRYLNPASAVLDIGCGTGYPIAAYLTQRGFAVTGIDFCENMIAKAKALQLPDAEFLLQDFLEFESKKKYDGVVAFDSLWHIPKESQAKIYQKISSLMNVGGYLLFTHGKSDGNVRGKMFGETFYYSALDGKEVGRILAENGFETLWWVEDYKEETGGERDLLVLSQKIS